MKTPKPLAGPPHRPRVMWAESCYPPCARELHCSPKQYRDAEETLLVLVLPLDPASLAAAQERVAKAIYQRQLIWHPGRKWDDPHADKTFARNEAFAALVALHPALAGRRKKSVK